MISRNALLCRLIARSGEALPAAADFEEAVDAADLGLAALCLARWGEVRRLGRVLPLIDAAGFALLSRYCLMLGLAGDPAGPLLMFDAMIVQKRDYPALWLDLALLQAALGYETQALRSFALHRALAGGGGAPVGTLPAGEAAAPADPGSFHVLAGDELRFHAM